MASTEAERAQEGRRRRGPWRAASRSLRDQYARRRWPQGRSERSWNGGGLGGRHTRGCGREGPGAGGRGLAGIGVGWQRKDSPGHRGEAEAAAWAGLPGDGATQPESGPTGANGRSARPGGPGKRAQPRPSGEKARRRGRQGRNLEKRPGGGEARSAATVAVVAGAPPCMSVPCSSSSKPGHRLGSGGGS